MRRIRYLVDSLIIDLYENGRLILFSGVLAFVGLFFMADIRQMTTDIQIFSLMQGAYFLSVNNEECSATELKNVEENSGILLHDAERFQINIDGKYAECYLYDDYIVKYLNYELAEGKMMENENEVLLSTRLKEDYDVGDTVVISGYDKDDNYIEKEKIICGFLKNNTIYYPHGTGDKIYNLLMVNVGDTNNLYYADAVICTDAQFTGKKSRLEKGSATYMVETCRDFDEEKLKKAIIDIGYLYSGEELVAQNEATLRYERNQKKVFVIAGLTLGLSVFMGNIYVSIVRRKKEQGIMMLTGATFGTAVTIVRLPGIISILLGTILGEICLIYLVDKGVLEGKYQCYQMLLVLGIIVCIYILCCIVLEVVWNKKNIIDLIERG